MEMEFKVLVLSLGKEKNSSYLFLGAVVKAENYSLPLD